MLYVKNVSWLENLSQLQKVHLQNLPLVNLDSPLEICNIWIGVHIQVVWLLYKIWLVNLWTWSQCCKFWSWSWWTPNNIAPPWISIWFSPMVTISSKRCSRRRRINWFVLESCKKVPLLDSLSSSATLSRVASEFNFLQSRFYLF